MDRRVLTVELSYDSSSSRDRVAHHLIVAERAAVLDGVGEHDGVEALGHLLHDSANSSALDGSSGSAATAPAASSAP